MSYNKDNKKEVQKEFYTSTNKGHLHEFKVLDKKTSSNVSHSHKIDYVRGIALPSNKHPHTHKLPRFSLALYNVLKNKKQLDKGTKIESEHTKSKRVAKVIAIAHLLENKDYYKKASVRGKNKLVKVK